MSDKQAIGARVRRIRRSQDITQEQLAARIGVAPSTVVRIETGQTSPSVETLFKLADALKVDPKWLLRGDEPERTEG